MTSDLDAKPAEIGTATLQCGDVLSRLKKIPDDVVDLVISSPPYNIGKSYERGDSRTLEEYTEWQTKIAKMLVNKVRDTGSICWQVGSFIRNGEVVPLDVIFYDIFHDLGWKLRNRIIWRFNFGLNADRRFSGRYETLLWFTKGDKYKFNLDPVRVRQIYPGKRHSKSRGDKAGQPSGNPLGKNPSDYWEFSAVKDFRENPIWEIPNVKSNHPEKTVHPCQFPIELAERCVLALSDENDLVLDPFVGTGASAIAAIKHNRRAVGIDRNKAFIRLAQERIADLEKGNLPYRPIGTPIRQPVVGERVATIPEEWAKAS